MVTFKTSGTDYGLYDTARKELLEHIGDRQVEYVHIIYDRGQYDKGQRDIPVVIAGTLPEILPMLDFEYDNSAEPQELFGNIWYKDGTWSERYKQVYDDGGKEVWAHKVCPSIPTR